MVTIVIPMDAMSAWRFQEKRYRQQTMIQPITTGQIWIGLVEISASIGIGLAHIAMMENYTVFPVQESTHDG